VIYLDVSEIVLTFAANGCEDRKRINYETKTKQIVFKGGHGAAHDAAHRHDGVGGGSYGAVRCHL
jgi:hypothetical protein